MDESYTVLCDIKAKNKIFRKACSEIILLNNKIEEIKARYDRAKAQRRLSFRYSNRLKLTALEGVRNLIYEYACAKCEEIEHLQAKLLALTGDVYDFVQTDDEGGDDDDEGDADDSDETEEEEGATHSADTESGTANAAASATDSTGNGSSDVTPPRATTSTQHNHASVTTPLRRSPRTPARPHAPTTPARPEPATSPLRPNSTPAYTLGGGSLDLGDESDDADSSDVPSSSQETASDTPANSRRTYPGCNSNSDDDAAMDTE